MIWIKCSWPGGVLAFISGFNGRGSCLPSHLGSEQLEEEDQLLEPRFVSELGSEGVVQLVEQSGSVCLGW